MNRTSLSRHRKQNNCRQHVMPNQNVSNEEKVDVELVEKIEEIEIKVKLLTLKDGSILLSYDPIVMHDFSIEVDVKKNE